MYQQQIVSSPPMNIKIEMSPNPLAIKFDSSAVIPLGLFLLAIEFTTPAIKAIEKMTAKMIR
jgi:hypothetical protein